MSGEMNGQKPEEDALLKLFEETERNYFQRIAAMFKGLRAEHDTFEYKAAMIEVQRLGAPLAAMFLLLTALLGLTLIQVGGEDKEVKVEVQVIEPEETQKLEEPPPPPEEPPPLEEPVEVDAPQVNIDAPPTTDATQSPQPRDMDAVALVNSPVIMKSVYGSRDPGTRGAMIGRFGGGDTDRYVTAFLRYLKTKQKPEGNWSGGAGYGAVGSTSIVLLTYLAHGETTASKEFGPTVMKTIKFLLSRVNYQNGRINGADTEEYAHPITVYALSEAYAMTRVPEIKTALEALLPTLIKGQNKAGSWDYKMRSDSPRSDSSYSGWCIQALKAAKLANINVPGIVEALKRSVNGMKALQREDGAIAYTPGNYAYLGLTSVGALCMQLLGEGDSAEAKKAYAYMKDWKPQFTKFAGVSPQYYCYYATQVRFFMGEKDPRWLSWNQQMKRTYTAAFIWQAKEKSKYVDAEGTPQPIGYWGAPATRDADLAALRADKGTKDGKRLGIPITELCVTDQLIDNPQDRSMAGCLVALQLMVYYRNTPMSKDALLGLESESNLSISEKKGDEVAVEGDDI